jgi:hypothetical protein
MMLYYIREHTGFSTNLTPNDCIVVIPDPSTARMILSRDSTPFIMVSCPFWTLLIVASSIYALTCRVYLSRATRVLRGR